MMWQSETIICYSNTGGMQMGEIVEAMHPRKNAMLRPTEGVYGHINDSSYWFYLVLHEYPDTVCFLLEFQ